MQKQVCGKSRYLWSICFFPQVCQNIMNSYWIMTAYIILSTSLHMNVVKGMLDFLPNMLVLIGLLLHVSPKKYQWYHLLFWQFLSTSVISAVIASSPVFAFLLCVAFPTSHMFLVNASVKFFLMPSPGVSMWQHTDYSLFFFTFW